MEKILNFATNHKKALTIFFIAKYIITAVIFIAILSVLWRAYDGPINAAQSFSEGICNIADTHTEVQAAEDYFHGESDDASQITDSMRETIDKYQQAREHHAQLLEAYNNMQNTCESFDTNSMN